MRRYRLGQGKLFDGVMKLITEPDADPEGLRLLNQVLSKPEPTNKLFELMMKDLNVSPAKMKPPRRKRMRRGVGSY